MLTWLLGINELKICRDEVEERNEFKCSKRNSSSHDANSMTQDFTNFYIRHIPRQNRFEVGLSKHT